MILSNLSTHMKSGVYKIEHIASGRIYVGSSSDFKTRLRKHREALNRRKHQNSALQNAWNSHGGNAFAFAPLLICSKNDLIFYEQAAINAFRAATKPYGYNIRKIAESNLGVPSGALTYRSGDKYGRLTLISQEEVGSSMWLCSCECGNEVTVRSASMRQGNTLSCGCYRKEKLSKLKTQHKPGDRFGRLTLVSLHELAAHNNGCHKWLCKCDCGNDHIVNISVLKCGRSKSCGCYRRELLSIRKSKEESGAKNDAK